MYCDGSRTKKDLGWVEVSTWSSAESKNRECLIIIITVIIMIMIMYTE